jgi:hypothetical protein
VDIVTALNKSMGRNAFKAAALTATIGNAAARNTTSHCEFSTLDKKSDFFL